jgi:hypothetical protein
MTSPPNYWFEGFTVYLYHSWPRHLMEMSVQVHAPFASTLEKGSPVLIGWESTYGRILLRRVLKIMVCVNSLNSVGSGQSQKADSCVIMMNLRVWGYSHLGCNILHSSKEDNDSIFRVRPKRCYPLTALHSITNWDYYNPKNRRRGNSKPSGSLKADNVLRKWVSVRCCHAQWM